MQRLALPFVLLIAVLGGLPGSARAAQSQDQPVTMTLSSQSAWNAPTKPLSIKVRVTNPTAQAITDVTLTLTIGFPTTSRSVYEESLTSDTTTPLFTTTFTEPGSIPAAGERSFAVRQALDEVPGLSETRPLLYPLRIALHGGDALLATIRTPMIFITPQPSAALNLAWTFELAGPMQVGPDGVFEPGPIEADIAPGGRIDRIVSALDRPDPPAVDLAISPVLLTELATMADGYRIVRPNGVQTVPVGIAGAADAARVLTALVRIAGSASVETVALPFADANLPAIERSGLGNLATLIARGRTDVGRALSVAPSTTVFRPPSSDLDGKSFVRLVDGGVQILLFDADTIPTPVGLPRSPASLADVVVGRRSALAILPDAHLAALTAAYPDDPVLAAHAALGEMAATWLEAPGTAARGVAMLFPQADPAPAAVYPNLIRLVASSPWLRRLRVSNFVGPTGVALPAGTVGLPVRHHAGFAPSYLDRLRSAQDGLRQFRVTATGPDAIAAQSTLGTDLLTAEGGTFVVAPALGLRYIDAVDGPRGAIAQTYGKVSAPPDGKKFTLTSRKGNLQLTISNGSQYSLHVRVALDAGPRLVFAGGGVQPRTLPPNATVAMQFQVRAETTGRFPLNVRVTTLSGATTIAESQVIVRSTAYNLVALIITVGAGLVLAVRWGMGVTRRRRS